MTTPPRFKPCRVARALHGVLCLPQSPFFLIREMCSVAFPKTNLTSTFWLIFSGQKDKPNRPPTTATGTVASAPSGTPPRLSNAASAMWGRAHPQGNVALPLSASLSLSLSLSSSERLVFPLLGWLQQRCIAIYGNDNFDRQPICLWAEWGLVDGQSCRHLPPLSGLSVVSRLMRPTLALLFFFFFF